MPSQTRARRAPDRSLTQQIEPTIEPPAAVGAGTASRFVLVSCAIAALLTAAAARLISDSFPFSTTHGEPVLVRGALATAQSGDMRPTAGGWGTLPEDVRVLLEAP